MYKSILGMLALGTTFALASGCGSDSKGGTGSKADYVAQCKRLCEKSKSCAGQEGDAIDCNDYCSDTPAPTGCNFGAIKAKVDECVQADCADLDTCSGEIIEMCPALDEEDPGAGGSSGSGGSSSGSGGSSSGSGGRNTGGGVAPGTGGGPSGGDCSVCEQMEECCIGLAEYAGQEPNGCDGLADACEGAGTQQSALIEQCRSLLESSSSLPVPACQ